MKASRKHLFFYSVSVLIEEFIYKDRIVAERTTRYKDKNSRSNYIQFYNNSGLVIRRHSSHSDDYGNWEISISKYIYDEFNNTEKSENQTIRVFPNPTKDFMHIELPQTIESGDFIMYAADGTMVCETLLEKGNFYSFPMDLFLSNTYIIKVNSKKGIFTGRVVKID